MPHPLLDLLGIEVPPPNEAEVLKNIYNDSFLQMKASEVMFEHFAAEAYRRMHPVAQAALAKRVWPTADNTIRWGVMIAPRSLQPILVATWRSEEMRFQGKPEDAPSFEFHGQRPSPEILARYAAAYDPANAASMGPEFWAAWHSKRK